MTEVPYYTRLTKFGSTKLREFVSGGNPISLSRLALGQSIQ